MFRCRITSRRVTPVARTTIHSYRPALSVMLTKVANTTRDTIGPVDLTPYLGDAGNVSVRKDVREEAGSFTLSFADRTDPNTLDSLYSLISPMDYVEIRMGRFVTQFRGGRPPIKMRGFVTSVQQSQTMGEDGRPMRILTVSGQDVGKLLAQFQIYYGEQYGIGKDLLTAFKLYANEDMPYETFSANAFMQAAMDHIILPNFSKLKADSYAPIPLGLKPDFSVQVGSIAPYQIQSYQGTLWGLMRSQADLTWNELFVQDRADGTYLVFRPLPYRDTHGGMINGAQDPGSVKVSLADVVKKDVGVSDRNVANYFWVWPPNYILNSETGIRYAAYSKKKDYFLQGSEAVNSDPNIYGIRKMMAQTYMNPTALGNSGVSLPELEQAHADISSAKWVAQRRSELVALDRDNVLYEEGTIEMMGNENVVPGKYLELDHGGDYTSSYYMAAVTDSFSPFASYKTTADVIRGDGQIKRLVAGRSPSWAENGHGVYGT